MPESGADKAADLKTVMMGEIVVGAASERIRTILGSCIGIALHDPRRRIGGIAHVVLPHSRGATETPGKFADTAAPKLIADILKAGGNRASIVAKIAGGASMFKVVNSQNIGALNEEAVRNVLKTHGVPLLAEDIGGEKGRRMTLEVETGVVLIEVPGKPVKKL